MSSSHRRRSRPKPPHPKSWVKRLEEDSLPPGSDARLHAKSLGEAGMLPTHSPIKRTASPIRPQKTHPPEPCVNHPKCRPSSCMEGVYPGRLLIRHFPRDRTVDIGPCSETSPEVTQRETCHANSQRRPVPHKNLLVGGVQTTFHLDGCGEERHSAGSAHHLRQCDPCHPSVTVHASHMGF